VRSALVIAFALTWGACAGNRERQRPATPSFVAALPPKPAAASASIEATHAEEEPDDDDEDEAPIAAPSASVSMPATPVCNPQKPFDYLIRKNYIPVKTKTKEHEKALRFRSETYGSIKGYGDPSWNKVTAKSEAVSTTFFGLTVTVNKKIVPAIKCAEAEIKATCGAFPYQPKSLSGLRDKNTYRAGEVTNHLWGIALDIDPTLNSCCGCVKKWQQSPLCKKKAKDIWERMAMPKCWVDAFEKYGFYWLGHDVLKDTMHFEFLADPTQIMVTPAPTSPAPSASSKPVALLTP
jgi:hypothetical protein